MSPTPAALAVALALVVPATASAKHKPLRCRALHGKIELATKAVKVVRGKDADGLAVLRGCAKPNGIVRVLGRAQDEGLGSSSVKASAAKGTWVLIDGAGSDQYASSRGTWLADARSGATNNLFSAVAYIGDPGYDKYLDALQWDELGRAVTIVGTPTGYANYQPTGFNEAVVMHAPDASITVDTGTRDEIPLASLAFANGTAQWTHGGAPRSATFNYR